MEFLKLLPAKIKEEIMKICASRNTSVSEIHLRVFGRCTLTAGGEKITLHSSVSESDAEMILQNATGPSAYRSKDMLLDGYIPLGGGVRLGVCGQARYNGGELVGISSVSSLVFRIPASKSDVGAELCEAFKSCKSGMLVFSSPAVGKTTALRTLVELLSKGKNSPNIAVADERCEFIREDYKNSSVDILSGYRRERGMEIALRCLSPDIIVIDEIGRREEVLRMLDFLSSGVKFIASAHALSYRELRMRRNLQPLFDSGVFDVFAGIKNQNGRRSVDIVKEENEIHRNDFNDNCRDIFEPDL